MKPDTPEREFAIRRLQFLSRTYDDLNKVITSTKNRLTALNPEVNYKHDFILGGEDDSKGLEFIKGKVTREIEKAVRAWPIYTKWLVNVKGIGPSTAANLILLYYYRFTPICPICGTFLTKKETDESSDDKKVNTFWCEKCQKSAKGDGVLTHRIVMRDFPNMSKWWAFMGIGIDPETGVKPKRQKNVQQNWSATGRKTNYLIGCQFLRHKMSTPYGAFLVERKRRSQRLHPEITPGHHLNRARHEAGKLFMSHFWSVAREIDGLSNATSTGVYAIELMGHTGYVAPFYWKDRLESDLQHETDFGFVDPDNYQEPPAPVKKEKKVKPKVARTRPATVARKKKAA